MDEQEIVGGRYRILEELGSGATARVYRTEDLVSKSEVALKLLSRKVTLRLGRERFLRELFITSDLSHPNIVRVIDCGRDENELFLTMPILSGGSLRDRLDGSPVGIDEAITIAARIAEALVYAHSRGFIHRDVKPENIMFDGDTPQLADFGVARALNMPPDQQLTLPGEAIGTPTYMSPEQAMGSGRLTSQCDCYALGVVLWEMLAGMPPFRGSHPEAIIVRRLDDNLASLGDVAKEAPQELSVLLAGVLEFSPRKRTPLRDFSNALLRLEQGRGDARR
jgi:serine/threonine protein kinase